MAHSPIAIGHDMALPFSVDLGTAGTLECIEKVRVIPNRRLVARARWRGQSVYAKLYAGNRKGKRDYTRERAGNAALAQRGIPAPELLHGGPAGPGGMQVIVYRAIDPAVGFGDALAAADDAQRERLLMRLISVVARHHKAGLRQEDMHFGNFIVSGADIYTLDGAEIDVYPREPGIEAALDNLALLLSQVEPDDPRLLQEAYVQYLTERLCTDRAEPFEKLLARIVRQTARRQRRYLRKIFRESTEFACRVTATRKIVSVRARLTPELAAFLDEPDRFIDEGVILKDGNTCTVARIEVDSHPLVVKRYNVKSVLHGVRKIAGRTRAAHSWRNAHLLRLCDIPTAAPIALIERFEAPLRRRAWFVMEAVPGRPASEYFGDERVPAHEREANADRIVRILDRLARNRISHGDLKATNFLVGADSVALIDLDAMRQHDGRRAFEQARERDLRRFLANWVDQPREKALFSQRLVQIPA